MKNTGKTRNDLYEFFALLRAGLWERELNNLYLDTVDLAKLNQLANEQAVVGLVAAGLDYTRGLNLPKDKILTFVGYALQVEQRNKLMNQFVAKIIREMQEKGISVLLVKGQGIAQCYENPLWRMCGDVDLLLDKINYEKAKQFLIPKASIVGTEIIDELHIGLTIESWEVELHGTLHSELSFKIDRQLDEIQNFVLSKGRVRTWQNGDVNVSLPDPNEDVIFVFVHILQHFYKGGIGLKQICDWSRLLWTYRESIDTSLLEERLHSMKLMSEWRAFAAFAIKYLGLPIEAVPLRSESDRWKLKADKICSFIIDVGNFGQNRDSSYICKKTYIRRKLISFWRRCKDLIHHAQIFPLDSFRFLPSITFNGLRSAIRGE